MMEIVEHYPGFQWAQPFGNGTKLKLERFGRELHVSGLQPLYETKGRPCDLVRQYEISRKLVGIGKQTTGKDSPHVRFANANTDEKLFAFVEQFGPVVAERVYDNFEKPEVGLPEPRWPPRLIAHQDIEELRNEQLLYRAALTLVTELALPVVDALVDQRCVAEIAAKIGDWPRQWNREQLSRKAEPPWELTSESLKRIEELSCSPPDLLLGRAVDGRIVICELLNCFRSTIFPNPLALHGSIRYGIRPLLYSILRRQLLYPRDVAICANSQCREFFEIERSGQRFCSAECSLRQRQRDYWTKRGHKLRKKRLKKQNKRK